MTVRENRALDELEDARADLRSHEQRLFWSLTALMSSIGAVLAGSVGSGGLSIALCILGGFGIVFSLIFGGISLFVVNERGTTHPADKLRRAERAYRDLLSDRVTGT